ncbi:MULTISPECIES: KGK domain-containing protein [Cyanophyceae]|uniref:KGK domain-containing protein n=1 Tax=Cyanophyceae TaxID=3028117 RepID=UPI00016DCA22|nr:MULTISPECIES: KGK domain-containing protein [Cyanophyceae]ACA99909.1 hypothetical protein SYNPCC7002_A1922 [Picosynechococcus sp. PCC 7002]SMH54851.1 KGK domain-containing protein [Picosynechococcus sp. OG1]SMQ83070.1 KGK domain-containing protein [Synechococcus sp. 7002]
MSKNFQPLSSGEVLSINSESRFVIGHSTFRVDEFAAALKQLLLEQGLGGLTEETVDWLTDNGIECDVLRFGASGWVKGKVRLHLEFAEEDGGEASADPKPKAAADLLPSVAASDFPSATASTTSESESDFDDLELEFNEAEFADLGLDFDDSASDTPETDLPDLDLPDMEVEPQDVSADLEDLNLATADGADFSDQDDLDDFEALFEESSDTAEADLAEPIDDLDDLFGEEDFDFDAAVAEVEPEIHGPDTASEETAGVTDTFSEDLDSEELEEAPDFAETMTPEADFTGIAPEADHGEENISTSTSEPVEKSTVNGKETIVFQETLVQPDEEFLENIFDQETSESPEQQASEAEAELQETDDLEALFAEDTPANALNEAISDEDLNDLFGDTEEGDFDLDLDLDEFADDDEPTAITVDSIEEQEMALTDLFDEPEQIPEEDDLFQSLLEENPTPETGDLETLDLPEDLPEMETESTPEALETDSLEAPNPFEGVTEDQAPTQADVSEADDPFTVFTGQNAESLDDLSGDLELSLDEAEEPLSEDSDLDLDDLFDDSEVSSPQNTQASEDDLGQFINVAMFRKKP